MIRKLLLLLAALFSLGFVLLSVILGAAHWQIRQLEPALPTARDITSALEETDSTALISYINTATQAGPLGTIGHIGAICGAQTAPATVFQTDSQRHLQNFGTSPGEENIAAAACARAVLDTSIVKHTAAT